MCHYFIQIWASLRVSRQDSLNQVPGCVRNVDVVWERITVLADTPVRRFYIGCFERRFAYDQGVYDNAE